MERRGQMGVSCLGARRTDHRRARPGEAHRAAYQRVWQEDDLYAHGDSAEDGIVREVTVRGAVVRASKKLRAALAVDVIMWGRRHVTARRPCTALST